MIPSTKILEFIKFFPICLVLIISVVSGFGQIDSLQEALSELEGQDRIAVLEQLIEHVNDKQKIPYLLELAESQKQSEPHQAFAYAQEAKRLSEKLQDDHQLAIAYSRMARIYFTPMLKYDSAQWAVDHALKILEKKAPSEELGRTYNTAGIINADQGKLDAGIDYFKKAENTFIQIEDHCWATTIHHNLGKLYKYSNQFNLAKQYFLECLEWFKDYDCKENYDYLFVNLGGMYEEEGAHDQALKFLYQGLEISRKMEHREGVGASLLMIGKIHYKLNEFSQAEQRFQEALKIGNQYNINKLIIAVNYELGVLKMKQQDYLHAKTFIDSGLNLAEKANKLNYMSTGFDLLHEYHLATGSPELALQNFKNHVLIRDSMEAQRVDMQVAALENEKKQNQIELLNKENEIIDLKLNRSKNYNYLLIGVTLLGLIMSYVLFRNYRHRQHAKAMEFKRQADQKILDMERGILASVIETENRERKRFAADLHDGLGPLLSSAKLYLGEIAEASTGEQLELTNYTREIVDSAIKNTREVSNNIIPASLSELGLFKSLQSFCDKIERVKDIHFSITISQGDQIQLNPGFEVVLYRVLTELINNTVKHADAKVVEIAFAEKDGVLDITYNDNGKGFEVQQVMKSSDRGMGLQNITRRIKSLHGDIQIKSIKQEGTNIDIHIPV